MITMKRAVYYNILLAGFSLVFVYHVFRLLAIQFADISLPNFYTIWLSYLLLYFIVFYETLHSEKAIKRSCIVLFPFVVVGKMMSIMHWPFGFLIFMISASLFWILLVISAYRSGENAALKILIVLYPLNRMVLHRLFYEYPAIPWWLVDFSLTGVIPVSLAIRWIRLRKSLHSQ